MRSHFQVLLTLISALFLTAVSVQGQVVISELHAAPSARLVRQDERGRTVLGSGAVWHDADYSAAAWAEGKAPLGFGVAGAATDTGSVMKGVTPSLYLRKTFTINSAAARAPVARL